MTSSAKWHVSAVLHTSSSLRHCCILEMLSCIVKSPKSRFQVLCSSSYSLLSSHSVAGSSFLGELSQLTASSGIRSRCDPRVVLSSCRLRQVTSTLLRISARAAGALRTPFSTLLSRLEPCKVLQAFRSFFGGPCTSLVIPTGHLLLFHLSSWGRTTTLQRNRTALYGSTSVLSYACREHQATSSNHVSTSISNRNNWHRFTSVVNWRRIHC